MIGKIDSFSSGINNSIALEQPLNLSIQDGELFLTISEITNHAIFICNNNWAILFANQRFADILNLEKLDIVNHSLFEIVFNSEITNNREFSDLSKGVISGFEKVGSIIKADSSEIKVNLSVSNIRCLESSNNCFLGIIEDITDLCRLEEEFISKDKMDTVGLIAGGLIHDFNNNLMGILGCAEILKSKLKNTVALDYANKMIKMASRASDLNASMLNYIKNDRCVLKPNNLHSIIDEALGILEPALGPTYSYTYAPNAKKSIIECDSVFIENAIINLAINARDAMYKGGEITIVTSNVTIKVGDVDTETGFSRPGEYIAIKVSDQGIGIKKELINKIFDPYFSTKGVNKGTGLGLYIVKRVISIHGGYIYVKSKELNGTTFTIFLPVFVGKYDYQSQKKIEKVITGKGTLLLVDDEDLIREVIQELLENLGYKVVSFGNTTDAISYYKNHYKDIDAVLLDMIMPIMTGIEVFEVLKFINSDIKAALLTGYSFKDDNEALLNRGFKTILNKPINKLELSIGISELINV